MICSKFVTNLTDSRWQIAISTIIQQHQNVVIYSNFKSALLLDIIELSKLQFLTEEIAQTAFTITLEVAGRSEHINHRASITA